ncbi:uncharacterized protein LOC123502602 isoform X2 [Portunus trituberculatus]|uniref:uncharacterized protein LOC123502602 isoform X2 n=1 Tax=Portunus trituberculatus TaxID=210409 RepID=UPI001E1D18C2|nr:uncharacterized protein LOC123502602 isoform X2 [Portunus trituberculatus]
MKSERQEEDRRLEVRVADDRDFERLKKLCDCPDGWSLAYENPPTRVYTRPTKNSTFHMIKQKQHMDKQTYLRENCDIDPAINRSQLGQDAVGQETINKRIGCWGSDFKPGADPGRCPRPNDF